MQKLHIDLETYSKAPLTGTKSVGTWAYSCHPSTRVLMLAWAFDDDEPALWLPGDDLPDWLVYEIGNAQRPYTLPFKICAWNDFFEYAIMKNVLKWPVPPPKYWEDTAAKAAALALPRGLGDCGVALGLAGDKAKDKAGKKLIQLFSVPKKSQARATKGQLIRQLPEDHPEQFEAFKKYCIQDVIAEREIDRRLPDLQKRTRRLWELDRAVNLRGVPFDVAAVHDARAVIADAKSAALAEVKHMTNGELTNIASRGQFLTYIEDAYNITLENARKEYLKAQARELADRGDDLARKAAELIRLRLRVSKSSLAKYDKIIDIIDGDRAYGLLRFHGASTGRWSGNLFQPQNLPRGSVDMPDLCIEVLKHRDAEIVEMLFGDALEAVSLSLRGMIKAPPGTRLIVSDFSQIESRMLAWLAGDNRKLDVYRDRLDIYKVNAAAAFKVNYEDVTKDQRQIGKVIELACGYQGGVGAFQQFANVYGVVIPDDEAEVLIGNWRTGNPKITSYWSNVENTAIKAVADPGTVQTVNNVSFKVIGTGNASFLFCRLPSGRAIAYHRPSLYESKFNRMQVQFYGVDSATKKYGRQKTYGGKLVENITQAASADAMIDKMFLVEPAGYKIILTVHDEIVAEVPEGHGSIEDFNSIMETPLTWAPGLPIAADGYEAKRYKK